MRARWWIIGVLLGGAWALSLVPSVSQDIKGKFGVIDVIGNDNHTPIVVVRRSGGRCPNSRYVPTSIYISSPFLRHLYKIFYMAGPQYHQERWLSPLVGACQLAVLGNHEFLPYVLVEHRTLLFRTNHGNFGHQCFQHFSRSELLSIPPICLRLQGKCRSNQLGLSTEIPV